MYDKIHYKLKKKKKKKNLTITTTYSICLSLQDIIYFMFNEKS